MKQVDVVPIPNYPNESVEEFIVALIEKKKSKIRICSMLTNYKKTILEV
ncbi:hypothetical protein BH18ACI3_BH18ACI3_20700 [soil metagenome]